MTSADPAGSRRYRQTVPRPPWARRGAPAPWATATHTRLTLHEVRQRLDGQLELSPQPGGAGAGDPLPPPSATAAVLVALFEREPGGEAEVLLIRRARHLSANPGEIAYPGGRLEPGESPEEAALREADEEIGLAPAAVEVLGRLPVRIRARSPGSIVPVVGLVAPAPRTAPNPAEVEEVLPVPLASLLADGVYWEEVWSPAGEPDFAMAFFADPAALGEDLVWGATARILTDLLRLVAGPLRPA